MPAVEPGVFFRECGAPPLRLELDIWLPGGCAELAWRGRACLRHGCGQRTPPHALGLAAGQSRCTCGRPRRAGAPAQPMSLSSPSLCGEVAGCERRVLHWQRRARPRLEGGCAARRAQGRVQPCVPGQHTPALCRGPAFGRPSRTPRRARHPAPLDVALRRALAGEVKTETWHTRR
jgi:hypothetical protein